MLLIEKIEKNNQYIHRPVDNKFVDKELGKLQGLDRIFLNKTTNLCTKYPQAVHKLRAFTQ